MECVILENIDTHTHTHTHIHTHTQNAHNTPAYSTAENYRSLLQKSPMILLLFDFILIIQVSDLDL